VRGKENPENEFDLVEIVEVTPVEQVTYAPNHPQMGGDEASLGACNNGA
jgi:branched-chain amino acid transport system substrate-binding protein